MRQITYVCNICKTSVKSPENMITLLAMKGKVTDATAGKANVHICSVCWPQLLYVSEKK